MTLLRPLVVLFIFLIASVGSTASAGDGTQPLCSPGTPACVTTNWGVIEPDSIDANAQKMNRSSAVSPKARPITVAVRPVPVAASSNDRIKTTISPTGLYIGETEKLVAALLRARFNRDGSIAKGEAQIASAAADIVRKAAGKYVLTIYVKVPQKVQADESTSLAKKVQAINTILSGSSAPQS